VTSKPVSGPSANFELAIVLPLSVAANQLMKVESELRFLNAKLRRFREERGSACGEAVACLEKMSEALDAIGQLVADMDIQVSESVSQAPTDRDD
jgi:hypothetical protein